MEAILTNKDDPPYDKNGNVTPVTGMTLITTIKLSKAWIIRPKANPKDKYFPNKSLHSKDILSDL